MHGAQGLCVHSHPAYRPLSYLQPLICLQAQVVESEAYVTETPKILTCLPCIIIDNVHQYIMLIGLRHPSISYGLGEKIELFTIANSNLVMITW